MGNSAEKLKRLPRPALAGYLILREGEALDIERTENGVRVERYALNADGTPDLVSEMPFSRLDFKRSVDWIQSLPTKMTQDEYKVGYEIARSLIQIDILLNPDSPREPLG